MAFWIELFLSSEENKRELVHGGGEYANGKLPSRGLKFKSSESHAQ